MPALWMMWFWWMPWMITVDIKRMQARATLRIVHEGDEDGHGTDR